MDIIILSIIILFVLFYVGAFRALKSITNMGVREATKVDAIHKAKVIDAYANLSELKEATVTKAKANKAALDSFEI